MCKEYLLLVSVAVYGPIVERFNMIPSWTGQILCPQAYPMVVEAALGSATCQTLCPQAYPMVVEAALGQYRGWSLVEIYVGGGLLYKVNAAYTY